MHLRINSFIAISIFQLIFLFPKATQKLESRYVHFGCVPSNFQLYSCNFVFKNSKIWALSLISNLNRKRIITYFHFKLGQVKKSTEISCNGTQPVYPVHLTIKSYLSHHIIDSFPRISKQNIIRSKPVLLAPSCRRPRLTKFVLIL